MAEISFPEAVAALNPKTDFVEQHRSARKVIKSASDDVDLKPLRIAILASSTVDHFVQILRAYLMRDGYRTEFYVAEFNTMFQVALDPESELYKFEPDLIWVFTNYRDLNFALEISADAADQSSDIDDAFEQFNAL